MTYEKFTVKFKRINAFDKYLNYLISIAVIGTGLFFLYQLHFTDWYSIKKETTKNIAPVWFINCFSAFFIILGSYGFWRIPKTYEITTIESTHSLSEKNQIIEQLISDFKLNQLEKVEEYLHFKYSGHFWNYFDIYIFYSRSHFYFNVQKRSYRGGFIDNGASKKFTRTIKKKLLAYL